MPPLRERSASTDPRLLFGAACGNERATKPGDLPIELSTKFELAINLKTAKVLGIATPQGLLSRADEVMQ